MTQQTNDDERRSIDGDFTDPPYTPTTKTVGTQREVTNWWCAMKVPVKTIEGRIAEFRSQTGNFRGTQYAEGHGKLKHYRTLEAIRTRNGLTITNSECFARGWAHCSPPRANQRDGSFPLTSLSTAISGAGTTSKRLYDIYVVGGVPKHREMPDWYDGEYHRLVDIEDVGPFGAVERKRGYSIDSLSRDEANDLYDAISEAKQ